MIHPLISDLTGLKDIELDAKIADLNNKYFMTKNTTIKTQILAVLNSYNDEFDRRKNVEYKRMLDHNSKDIKKVDNLINIS